MEELKWLQTPPTEEHIGRNVLFEDGMSIHEIQFGTISRRKKHRKKGKGEASEEEELSGSLVFRVGKEQHDVNILAMNPDSRWMLIPRVLHKASRGR